MSAWQRSGKAPHMLSQVKLGMTADIRAGGQPGEAASPAVRGMFAPVCFCVLADLKRWRMGRRDNIRAELFG